MSRQKRIDELNQILGQFDLKSARRIHILEKCQGINRDGISIVETWSTEDASSYWVAIPEEKESEPSFTKTEIQRRKRLK